LVILLEVNKGCNFWRVLKPPKVITITKSIL
jgi:hypothetical protein